MVPEILIVGMYGFCRQTIFLDLWQISTIAREEKKDKNVKPLPLFMKLLLKNQLRKWHHNPLHKFFAQQATGIFFQVETFDMPMDSNFLGILSLLNTSLVSLTASQLGDNAYALLQLSICQIPSDATEDLQTPMQMDTSL